MKLLLWATAFLFSVSGLEDDEWNRYKERHKKVYTTREEDMRRLQQYLKSKQMVEEHNRRYRRGETSYTMAINRFSDWFPEEMHTPVDFKPDTSGFSGKEFELPAGTPVPKSINWVKRGAVTKVKDEGKCHSSYAFSAAGALEALMFIQNKTLTDLSVQELYDCSGGGFPSCCYKYVMHHGLQKNASYPYEGKRQACRRNGTAVAHCNGYTRIFGELALKKSVGTLGPVSVMFAADSEFWHYNSGIYDGPCSEYPRLGILVVGYGTERKTKEDYWLVKNSWGDQWGEKGFARVKRNVGLCQLGLYSYYPVEI